MIQLLGTILSIWALATTMAANEFPVMTKLGCQEKCGKVRIRYPFGIGKGCYLNPSFEITCNSSSPFLRSLNLQVEEITFKDYSSNNNFQIDILQTITVKNPVERTCVVGNTNKISSLDLGATPYWFSTSENVVVVSGCGSSVIIKNKSDEIQGGCSSFCEHDHPPVFDTTLPLSSSCLGFGCCVIDLSDNDDDDDDDSSNSNYLDFYDLNIYNNFPSTTTTATRNCTTVMLIDETYTVDEYDELDQLSAAPTVLGWLVSNHTGITLPSFDEYYMRSCRIISYSPKMEQGLVCYCEQGYYGNPYISYGCQVRSECRGCGPFECFQKDDNSYSCNHIKRQNNWGPTALIVIASVFGVLLGCSGNIYVCFKKRKHMIMKEKFFKENGGLLLEQQLALYGGAESTRIFKVIELKAATKNYNKANILGKGGFGIVYKGVLSNQQVVAIKKSNISSEGQVEQFINEVAILTQINHRNVVKLLGCCLETEVPLLVYEYISNGNLFEHIHERDDAPWLSWENCLRIAIEAANAIAYLHSAASIPIIHRDIKSSNILLDDNFTVKISDFGTSRLVPIDESQVTTLVQGTFGYLDPEYFQTNHLTEKSDVYSFGVVLLELLTRRKPLLLENGGEDATLAAYFLLSMKRNQLFEIIEPRLVKEATEEQLSKIAKLVEQCLSVKGDDRPSMKEAAKVLEELRNHVETLKREQAYNEEKHEISRSEVWNEHNKVPYSSDNYESRQYSVEKDMILEMGFPR